MLTNATLRIYGRRVKVILGIYWIPGPFPVRESLDALEPSAARMTVLINVR